MELKELLDNFAVKYGIDGIVIEDGEATLVVEFTAVKIREATNAKAIIVTAVIGGPVPDSKGRLASFMLQANHIFSGADAMTICQNPETDEYVVLRAIPKAIADVDSLSETIETLVAIVEEWRENLVEFMDVDRESEQKEEDEAEFSPLSPLFGGYFIRV